MVWEARPAPGVDPPPDVIREKHCPLKLGCHVGNEPVVGGGCHQSACGVLENVSVIHRGGTKGGTDPLGGNVFENEREKSRKCCACGTMLWVCLLGGTGVRLKDPGTGSQRGPKPIGGTLFLKMKRDKRSKCHACGTMLWSQFFFLGGGAGEKTLSPSGSTPGSIRSSFCVSAPLAPGPRVRYPVCRRPVSTHEA